MKLKNIGNKIISIGATVILPGEAKEVTGYDDNEIVKFFIRQTVDGVRYDTRKAESLCSNKAVMFEDFYVELFEDAAGNYFTVLYQLSGCQHHTITPVSPYIAKQFWERFSRKVG